MKLHLCASLFLMSSISICFAKPDGAPLSTCAQLTPVHSSLKVQEGKPPFTVSAVKSGAKVKVTITSPVGEEFEGFVLQARSKNDKSKMIDGEFTESQGSKAIDCFNGKKNTLTHVDTGRKKEIVTEWSPKAAVDEVVFRATVAKTYNFFWTKIDSSPLKIGKQDDMSRTGEFQVTKAADGHSMYDNCFDTKGCFGLPQDCVVRKDCRVLVTYSKTTTGVVFHMDGFLQQSNYMAMGLSNDALMGDDSVTECIRDGVSVVVRDSWNEGRSNTRTVELKAGQHSSSVKDELSSCEFTRKFNFTTNGRNYDLENEKFYILLAIGDVADGKLKYHGDRISSSEAINFTSFEMIEGMGVTYTVKVHDFTTIQESIAPSSIYTYTQPSTGKSGAKTANANFSSQFNFVFIVTIVQLLLVEFNSQPCYG